MNDDEFEKWLASHPLSSSYYSTEEHEEKQTLARDAFEAGYNLAIKHAEEATGLRNFFSKMVSK